MAYLYFLSFCEHMIHLMFEIDDILLDFGVSKSGRELFLNTAGNNDAESSRSDNQGSTVGFLVTKNFIASIYN